MNQPEHHPSRPPRIPTGWTGALVITGSLLVGGLLAMGCLEWIGRDGAFSPIGPNPTPDETALGNRGRLPPARPAWLSPLQPSCSIQDLAQRQHLQALVGALRTAPKRVRVDPSNFGERFRRDAFGQVIDPTPRLVVLHETV